VLIAEISGQHPDAVRDRSARRIQRAWRVCVADPAFLACRRRLQHEFLWCSACGRPPKKL
jgi:hypothetical protein